MPTGFLCLFVSLDRERSGRWMAGWVWIIVGTVCLATVGGVQAETPYPATFYVDSHGWHSGLVIPRAAILRGTWPRGVAEHDFAGCAYLELGWGDRAFYQAKNPGAWLALKASLVPGPSVLHIVGLNPPLADAHAWSTLIPVPCTRAELDGLCRDLGRNFETDAHGKTTCLGPGLYGKKSGFYPARGRYWIGNTCNTWTARELQAGGLPASASVFRATTSGQVVKQTRELTRARALRPPAPATALR